MTLKTQSDLFTPLRPRPPTALAMKSVPLPDPSGRSGPLASPTEPWRLSPLLAPRDHCCAFPLPGSPLLHREATPDPAPLPASSPCGRRRSSSQRTRGRSSGPLSGATRPAGRTPPGLRTWRGGVGVPGGTLLFTATPAEGASHDFRVYSCLNQVHAQLGLKQRFLSHRGLGNATGLTGRVGGLGLSGNPQQRLLAARHPVSKPPVRWPS